jgi:hypothetical protein
MSELDESAEKYCAECGRPTLHRFCKKCRRRMKREGVGQSETVDDMQLPDESGIPDKTIDGMLDTLVNDDAS